jgi:hypothetical protein
MTEVANSQTAVSLQPPQRTAVVTQIAKILDAAPTHERAGLPVGFSYHDLASRVYRTDEPAAAQLSAVRRAVARLVAQGRAVRDIGGRGRMGAGWHEPGHNPGTHWRRSRKDPRHRYQYANPARITIHRAMTEADRELFEASKAAWLAAQGYRTVEEARRALGLSASSE